jgi:hypothetical protein
METSVECVCERRLDSKNKKTPSQKFYTEKALEQFKEYYARNAPAIETS